MPDAQPEIDALKTAMAAEVAKVAALEAELVTAKATAAGGVLTDQQANDIRAAVAALGK